MSRAALISMVVAALPVPALAEDERATVERSRLSWEAFQCSTLAELSGDPEQQERLFTLGYDEGMAFLRAVDAEEVSAEEAWAHSPAAFSLRLGGPSHDFRLGRIYEATITAVYDQVYEDGAGLRQRAEREFEGRNCGLLK